jgi:hypothetical protein
MKFYAYVIVSESSIDVGVYTDQDKMLRRMCSDLCELQQDNMKLQWSHSDSGCVEAKNAEDALRQLSMYNWAEEEVVPKVSSKVSPPGRKVVEPKPQWTGPKPCVTENYDDPRKVEWKAGDVAAAEVHTALLLADVEVPITTIEEWTEEQRRAAGTWAMAIHLDASDNDVRVPPKPMFLEKFGAPVAIGYVIRYPIKDSDSGKPDFYAVVTGKGKNRSCNKNGSLATATVLPEKKYAVEMANIYLLSGSADHDDAQVWQVRTDFLDSRELVEAVG